MTKIEFKRLRKGLGTQSEAAKLLGTSQPAISAYERGKRPIAAGIAARLREAGRAGVGK